MLTCVFDPCMLVCSCRTKLWLKWVRCEQGSVKRNKGLFNVASVVCSSRPVLRNELYLITSSKHTQYLVLDLGLRYAQPSPTIIIRYQFRYDMPVDVLHTVIDKPVSSNKRATSLHWTMKHYQSADLAGTRPLPLARTMLNLWQIPMTEATLLACSSMLALAVVTVLCVCARKPNWPS